MKQQDTNNKNYLFRVDDRYIEVKAQTEKEAIDIMLTNHWTIIEKAYKVVLVCGELLTDVIFESDFSNVKMEVKK